MGKSSLLTIILILISSIFHAQQLNVLGDLTVRDALASPEAGMVTWTGEDFEGYNGTEWVSFTSSTTEQGVISNGLMSDIEGNAYKVVTIGTQVWMAENLKTLTYDDGTEIPYLEDSLSWRVAIEMDFEGYGWYEGDEKKKHPYGPLYNGLVVMTNKICPSGWHVPSNSEFEVLINFAGGQSAAGNPLKAKGNSPSLNGLWLNNFSDGTDLHDFAALPAGYKFPDSTSKNLGRNAYFWTSTVAGTNTNNYKGMSFINTAMLQGSLNYEHGLSIRCLQD